MKENNDQSENSEETKPKSYLGSFGYLLMLIAFFQKEHLMPNL